MDGVASLSRTSTVPEAPVTPDSYRDGVGIQILIYISTRMRPVLHKLSVAPMFLVLSFKNE